MKFHYYPETDSLYIDLADRPSSDSREISNGVVADFDDKGSLVGLDIQNASRTVDLKRLEAIHIPVSTVEIGSP